MQDLIHVDHNGFIKRRSIGDNAHLLFNVIDYVDAHDLSGKIMSLDIYKAFDSLEWDFLFKSLHCYGFDKFLIDKMKICYSSPSCRVTDNNWLFELFKVKRGVRQGDPLSPCLFFSY